MDGLFRLAGDVFRGVYRATDRKLGGILPGGGTRAPDVVRRVAENAANLLPGPANLFVRYAGNIGGGNLKLDRPTQKALLRVAEVSPTTAGDARRLQPQTGLGTVNVFPAVYSPIPGPPRIVEGDVFPYDKGQPLAETSLGRYTVKQVRPTEVVVTDTPYDMVNESEDPELTAPRIQPGKAFNEIVGIFDGRSGFLDKRTFSNSGNPYSKPSFNSPATSAARALLYMLPYTPNTYPIQNSPEGFIIKR
jgi:hypothetical protein